jgi:hypothetical protein
VAVEDRFKVGGKEVFTGTVFARRIPAREDCVKVLSALGAICLPDPTGKQYAPEPRPRRQPHECGGENAEDGRETEEQTFIERPTLTGALTQRRELSSDSAQKLRVLARHPAQYLVVG